jgi:hypothetical protein
VTGASTARYGAASIAGGERRAVARVSGIWKKFRGGEEEDDGQGFSGYLYPSGGRRWSRESLLAAGTWLAGVAVASSRASRTKTKARTSPRSYPGRKGIGLVWAKVWEWTMGCSWAATARYGPGEFFSPFYFLFLIFCFYIFYLNSYMNSMLFAGICNYTNSFKI